LSIKSNFIKNAIDLPLLPNLPSFDIRAPRTQRLIQGFVTSLFILVSNFHPSPFPGIGRPLQIFLILARTVGIPFTFLSPQLRLRIRFPFPKHFTLAPSRRLFIQWIIKLVVISTKRRSSLRPVSLLSAWDRPQVSNFVHIHLVGLRSLILRSYIPRGIPGSLIPSCRLIALVIVIRCESSLGSTLKRPCSFFVPIYQFFAFDA
jgi:hypothetical protein